jgi:hypothetical protein
MLNPFSVSRLLMAGTALTVVFAASAMAQDAKSTVSGPVKSPVAVSRTSTQTVPNYPQVTGDPAKDKAMYELRAQHPDRPAMEFMTPSQEGQTAVTRQAEQPTVTTPKIGDPTKPNPLGLTAPAGTENKVVAQPLAVKAGPNPMNMTGDQKAVAPTVQKFPNQPNPAGIEPSKRMSPADQAKENFEKLNPLPAQK